MPDIGFDGTANEADFAWMWRLGPGDAVADDAAWKVTAGSGRSVNVAAAGYAFAAGVLSYSKGTLNVSLSPTPTNGQWFLIARRINWSANTVTAVALAHTTTSSATTVPTVVPTTIPATAQSTPGGTYDHALAWAWINSANTTVTIFDLRALPLVDRVTQRVAPERLPGVPTAQLTGFASGWSHHDAGTDPAIASVSGKTLFLSGRVSKAAGSGTTILTLPVGLRPESLNVFVAPTAASGVQFIWVFPDGTVQAPDSGTAAVTGCRCPTRCGSRSPW
jgi:hypothetical protein